ncbi:malonate--CoA ligase ACSF3, mitochondrial-like isoform X2 [Babylonia areolata]
MIANMVSAWTWSPRDVILHVLPLHHVHGLINALMTPLHVGASCLMLPKFDPQQVWHNLVNPMSHTDGVRVNVFMAVPTIYAKLIEHYDQHLHRGRGSRLACEYIKSVCMERIRLMVSGSSALPQPVMEKWESITGHRLLERYGMTEIGMALTNPLSGPRIAGCVGKPFPSVEVRIAKPNVYAKNGYDVIATGNAKRTTVTPGQEGESGELLVRGPSVFHQYWNRPEATKETFTPDGWFKTGDTAMVDSQAVYKIVGRTSVDVIKSGGYKISALDVERHLLTHAAVSDCAVVGLPDITWGQRVAAVVVLKEGHQLTLEDLKIWARNVLPPYQTPTVLHCLPQMPRNSMGKVNKKELVASVFPEFLKDR